MTTINNQEDFLRALEENPQWKAAVRALILGEELLRLPAHFDAFVNQMNAFVDRTTAFVDRMTVFVDEQRQINDNEQRQFNAEQRQINDEQRQFNAEQRQFNEGFTRRLDRIEGDIGNLRGAYARVTALRDAMSIAMDMGFEYVRTVPHDELVLMAQRAAGSIPTNELRSFRQADLIIEATDGSATHYIAVETSYTADQRDTGRAQRNARFLADFTGHAAHPAIASVRNDRHATQVIDSGGVYWHPLNDRGPAAPE